MTWASTLFSGVIMDKAIIFELIAGGWATATLLLVLGFLNAMRQEIGRIHGDFGRKLDKIDNRITKVEDRIYDLKKYDAAQKKC